ncbi:error-prone DNA polymerase [Piscinibacter sakaiensis]|uniref:Error-prone DNA polymerase n=1 Tax=Piscinibacter sakaiensis TaxID=1547922 RepID=A0A0K8P2X0_PISS1|nr:error-prone DNA polymerase [Piscinibacter sakaiensis]GAP36874.1 DNA polymerase III, alpha subunit [Piscinibacter sakaiensis]
MSALPAYAELHCRSNFSFLCGASHPEELVARAHRLGYAALALTDECSLAGVVRAHGEAQRCGLHLVIGSELRLQRPDGAPHARLVVLAQDRRGYGNLSRWITVARRRAAKGSYLAHPGDLEGRVPDAPMLAGLPGCLVLLVPQPDEPLEALYAQAMWLRTWFDDRAALLAESLLRPGDEALREQLLEVARRTGLPVAAAGDVTMHLRSRKPLQDVLTATRLRCSVAEAGLGLAPNAEQHLRTRSRVARLYPAAWLDEAVRLASRCRFSLAELRYEYPQELVPPGLSPAEHLRALTLAGAGRRFPQGLPRRWQRQIEHELELIARKSYEAFFLTVADIVAWARAQGILCQGRGSAANSLVCYCLHITEVDPRRASLLFERFVSLERDEPPDIDVDFEHQRREEVIQHIYRKYGRHRAALAAVVICYRPRSALRDVGRALGIDLQRIEAVAKTHQWYDGHGIHPDRLRENGFDPASPVTRLWSELTGQLVGFPRHLSQHPGGFVIAKEQVALLVPVENAAMEGRSVIQWDKDDLEALGLIKVDVLALGMLSAIRRALALIGDKCGSVVDMPRILGGAGFTRVDGGAADAEGDAASDPGAGPGADGDPAHAAAVDVAPAPGAREADGQIDEATYDMICAADTVGVFQIESRAQMSMLPRLRPRHYYDLVIEVAIVRPGPIQGGMVHPYLANRDKPEAAIDIPPELRPALQRTRGVPIFQEQVMQIAILAADFTPGEADQLRRAMAAWKRKGGLGPFHERLVGRMKAKGYAADFAERIFRQIEGFGEYGFPESHAAGFALLVYVSAWIKCHHPDAFLCALLNSQPLGFYAPAQLVRDARAHGVVVRPVDVAVSGWDSGYEPDALAAQRARAAAGEAVPWGPGAPRLPVRLGLGRVAGLSAAAGERLLQARREAPFADVEDLARRARLDRRELQALADADALRGLGGHRHRAAWAVAGIDTTAPALLGDAAAADPLADLAPPSEGEDLLADYRSLGLTLNRHPLALLRPRLEALRVQTAAELQALPDGRIARACGLVTHRQRPQTAKGTIFVTLEDDTGAVNVIVWPAVAEAQRTALIGARLLTVHGRWQREGEVTHLVAARLVDHTPLLQGLVSRSRDFR